MSKNRSVDVEQLASLLSALSNPQRLRIFLRLATRCCSVNCCEATPEGIRHCIGDLGRGLGLADSTISHHIKELRQAGLIQVERKGQRIECWVIPEPVLLLASLFQEAGSGRGTHADGGDRWTPRTESARTPAAAAAGKAPKTKRAVRVPE
jgi:DNA-binding transcriptional ArsR family regulator